MLRKLLISTVPLIVAACGSKPVGSLKDGLPGTYELFIGANQSFSRSDFSQSTLLIKSDGTFEQSCMYKSPQTSVDSKGTWEIDSDTGVRFEGFLDCAGVWPGRDVSVASLIVRDSEKPQISLNPDLNIFYRRSGY
jgi:hypothetical protein